MKNGLLLSLILLSTLSLQAQRRLYTFQVKEPIQLSLFKQNNNFYNISRLKSENPLNLRRQSQALADLQGFLIESNAVSFRKLIRRLPDNFASLKMRNGQIVSIEAIQQMFVMETENPIPLSQINALKTNHPIILEINESQNVRPDAWPPNDPNYTSQGQFYNTPYNLGLPRAWNYTYGNPDVKVAIVDNGVDYRHPDLGGNIGVGFRVRGGWDYKDDDGDPKPEYPDEYHGTPIAGIIGANNWNNLGGIGIAGGSPANPTYNDGCQLFSLRVSSDEQGQFGGARLLSRALITEAVFEAATDPTVNNGFGFGVDIINCSFGGPPPMTKTITTPSGGLGQMG